MSVYLVLLVIFPGSEGEIPRRGPGGQDDESNSSHSGFRQLSGSAGTKKVELLRDIGVTVIDLDSNVENVGWLSGGLSLPLPGLVIP